MRRGNLLIYSTSSYYLDTFYIPSSYQLRQLTDLVRTRLLENSQQTMGKQTDIKLRCTVKNIIYYQWRDIHCIRTKPVRVRQTKPTKAAAKNFGIAVKNSAVMRSMLKPLFPDAADRSNIYKMDSAFRQWLPGKPLENPAPVDGIPFFDELSFNEAVELRHVMGIKVPVSRRDESNIVLQWPEFNPVVHIKAPAGTVRVVIQYIVATLDMAREGAHHYSATDITIPYINEAMPEQEISFQNVTGANCLSLVGMAIRYYRNAIQNNPVNILRWKPAGIAGSFYN